MRDLLRNRPSTVAWTFNAAVWVTLGFLVFSALLLRLQVPALYDPFDTDEADYASALSYGLGANYLGLNERTGWEFLASTTKEFLDTGRARPFSNDWAAGDAAALRHYHPPTGLYPAAAIMDAGERREHVLRLVPLITAVLTAVAGAWLAWVLTLDLPPPRRLLAAALALAFTVLSPWHVASSVTLSFHQGFWLLAVVGLGLASLVWKTGSVRSWYALTAVLGVAVATIPYWLLLVPIASAVLWRAPWPSGANRIRLAISGLVLAALSLTLVWPPALLRGDLVKPAMLYAWIVIEPLDGGGRADSWLVSLVENHWWVLIVPLLPALIRRRGGRDILWHALPVLAFVTLFLLLNSRVHHMKPLYAAAVIPAAAALAAAAVACLLPAWPGRHALPLSVAGSLLALAVVVGRDSGEPRDDWRPAMSTLAERLSGRTVLVAPRPAAGTFRYYLPASRLVLDAAEAADEPAIVAGLAGGGITDVIALPVAEPRIRAMLPACFERKLDLRIATMLVHHWQRRAVCADGAE